MQFTSHYAFALILNIITWLMLLLSMSCDQVNGIRHNCGDVPNIGVTARDNSTGGYKLAVRHERLDPYLDLLPNMTYTVEVDHDGDDRRIHALELDITYDGYEDMNGSDVHTVRCGKLQTPVRVEWIPHYTLESCVRLKAIVWSNETKSFDISLKICKPSGCRKYYSANTGGTVNSPGFPLKYTDNYQCTYVIYTSNQHQVRFQFRSFDLEPAYDRDCFDSVLIETTDNTTTICGTRNITGLNDLNFHSDDGILIVTFVTDYKVVAGGFEAYYYSIEKANIDSCSYTTSNISGKIYSLNHPHEYYPMMKCMVHIILPTRFRISLHLQYLDLDISTKGRNCSDNDDYLNIMQNFTDNGQLQRNNFYFCGSKKNYYAEQTLIQSSGSSVDVIFQSYSLHEGKGFVIQYNGIESCKNNTYLDIINGNLNSVNFPDNYLNDQNCVSIINLTDYSGILELKFTYFHTVSNENDACMNAGSCREDFVDINTDGVMTRICGHCTRDRIPLLFYSSSRFIEVRFVSNGHLTRPGFSGHWRLVDNKPSNDFVCPTISMDTDDITYDFVFETRSWSEANLDCRNNGGLLASITNTFTQVLIDQFLRNISYCTQMSSFWIGASDHVFEGDFYWADLTRLNFTYWFEGWPENGFKIKQPSDDGLSDEDCVEIRNSFPLPVKGEKGTHNYYWNDRNCLIRNPYICQRSKHGATPSTTWNSLKTTTVVNVQIDTQEQVVIQSQNFPSNYDDFTDTTHHLTSSNPFHRLHVYFEAFDLEPSESCICDNFTLASFTSTSPDIVRCGNWDTKIKLMDWTSQSNQADLRFRTDNSVSAPGFKLLVVAREDPGCMKAFHDVYPKLVVDSKIMLLSDNLLCYLIVPRVTDSFQNAKTTCAMYNASLLYQTSNEQCLLWTKAIRSIYSDYSQEFISVWTGDGTGKNGSLCGMRNVRLSGNSCLDKDVMSYSDCNTPRPFICVREHHLTDAVQISTEVLGNSTGQIKNTGHPYDNNLHKEYELHAADGNRIFVTLEFLEIEYQEECLYDYLSLNEIMGNSTTLCGNESTIRKKHFLSKEQHIKIIFHTDSSIVAGGFALSWKWINKEECVQNVRVNNNVIGGIISSINYPLPYPDIVRCCKSFNCPSNSRMIIIFNNINILQNRSEPALVLHTGERSVTLPHKLNTSFHVSQRTFISDNSDLRLCLNTDSIEENEGFFGTYSISNEEIIRVSETIKISPNQQSSEIIQSLHFPNSAPQNSEQTIYLTTDIGSDILLEFSNVNLMDSLRYTTYLDITDTSLGKGHERLIVNMTANSTSQGLAVFRSHLNSVRVIFSSGCGSGKQCMFKARYSTTKDDQYLEKTKAITDGTINFCGNDTCFNGGFCISLENERYACKCGVNYTGLFCQTYMCDLFPCEHGECDIKDGGATCECESNIWGEHCNMTKIQCNDDRCQGHGVCAEPQNSPKCVCTEQWTGKSCFSEKPVQKTITGTGEKLLKEPIWIGMIVVLNLVFAFTSMFIVRRRCEKKLKCCTETKSTEHDIGTDCSNIKRGPDRLVENNYPCLGDMYKHYRYPANDQDASFEDKEGEDFGDEIESPDINFGNHRAAAKLFASYNNRQSDLTVPVMEKRPTMMEKDSEDSVGGMKGGTLNFCTATDMDMPCDEISESEIAEACFDAAVPILKISELGMQSFDQNYLSTFHKKSPQVGKKLFPKNVEHCYPEIVVVDSTPTHMVDSPALHRSGLFSYLEMPYESPTAQRPQLPFKLLDVDSKRKRFASKLRVEKTPFKNESLSVPHSSVSTINLNSSTDFPDVLVTVDSSEFPGLTSFECNRLDRRRKPERKGQIRSACSYEEMYGTETSECGTDPMELDRLEKRPSISSKAENTSRGDQCNNGGASDRKVRVARTGRRRRGHWHSHEISSAKVRNTQLAKTSSDTDLQNISKTKHKHGRPRKKHRNQQSQSIQRMIESSIADNTSHGSTSRISVRKSRSNDLVPNHMANSPCSLGNGSDEKVLYAPTVQRRHSYHPQQNSENVYDPDSMLNTDQCLAYRLEKSENDLPRLPPFSSYDVLHESSTSSDVSGMFLTSTNKSGTLKVPLTSDTDTGFSSSRSLLTPSGGKDDADIFIQSVGRVKKMDSAYQTKQNSDDVINKAASTRGQDSRENNTRKETKVIARLQQAALRLQTLSSSWDSAVQTTISEDELDDNHRHNNRISEHLRQKEGLEEVSEENDVTGYTFSSDSLMNDGSLHDSVLDIELHDFSCV